MGESLGYEVCRFAHCIINYAMDMPSGCDNSLTVAVIYVKIVCNLEDGLAARHQGPYVEIEHDRRMVLAVRVL